ncbi:SusC/RagA family TonB-linked outer membrane protein [Roseivirga echinicomitans]|uniref:SusC/RagA family TonB-linked outer membrane protein n=1 Tax=Roseivirga echinicomitans TaxID=296218 RepID=A0A150XPX5_9BACT|nr:TonB-dependent receptor [Roseivirga echinicomitans]KYG80799.1 SusC/RagA family TonB-linked outer membrane protein [Roseivirga echinicomitans]
MKGLTSIFSTQHRQLRRTCLMLMCLCVSVLGFAQDLNVKGLISDVEGQPIFGVTVFEKGTTNGMITGADGEYSIKVKSQESVIVFSFVGFLSQEVTVNNQSTINITLEEDIKELQEFVVVGYGVEKKVNLSGAVDQVDAQQLAKRPISSVTEGLQGVIPNLNIDSNSGAPGATPNINIRGITSINGGSPLILIDGVPSDAVELNRIAPQDIESISVIKDASSAAIYGARAAFGVVIITTKNGSDKMKISYSGYTSMNQATVLPDKITDPYIYSRLLETSTDNTPWDNINFSDQYYAWARDRSNDSSLPGVRMNPTNEAAWEYMGGEDWSRHFMKDQTTSSNHQLSISGGDDRTSYLLSGSYSHQDGVLAIADDYFDRYTVRSKVSYKANDWLTLSNNTYLTTTERKEPSYFDITSIYNIAPTSWDVNPDGSWANSEAGVISAQLTDGGEDITEFTSVQSQFGVQAELLKDVLTFNTDFTFRRGRQDRNWFQTKYNIGFGPSDIREQGNNSAYRSSTVENYYVLNSYLSYRQQFGDHALSGTLGFNQEHNRWNSFSAQRNNVISASLPTIALATGDQFVDENVSEWAVRGVFYRLNYIYNDKYIVEFNGRYDGASKFPSNNRYGFFPSASVAWRVDEENFMAGMRDWVSQFKLRGSIGSLGNQAIGPYEYISTMDAYQGNYLIDGKLPLEISSPQLVSNNFSWEEVVTRNFGVDMGFLENKVTASFDIYRRDTKGMLTLGRELPDVLGATEPKENAADLKTNGWEFSFGYQNEVSLSGKPLNFKAGFNLSDSRSFITKFDNPTGSITQFYEGMELGQIWGLQNDGFFRSVEEIDALDQNAIVPWGAISIVEGWPKYKDLNGDNKITKGYTLDDTKDLSIIGNQSPRYRYGMNLSADWNGFDISVLFQGVGKRDYYPLDYLYWGFYQQPYAGGYAHLNDFYRAESETGADRDRHSQSYIDAGLADQNLDAKYPHLQSWLADRNLGERIDQAQGLAIPQTDYLLSAAYLRLKNLTIGYTLPVKLMSRTGLSNVRVYASGENLFEWSALKDYFDPEAVNNAIQYNPAVSGGRGVGKGYTYPFQRRYVLGINITL